MTGADVRLYTLPARLRWTFRHASAVRDRMENVIVRLTGATPDRDGYGEACPRAYVTGETVASVTAVVREVGPGFAVAVDSVPALVSWMAANTPLIDAHPAAFAALECAALDRIGRRDGVALEALLGADRPADVAQYSAVLGDAARPLFAAQALAYRLAGLRSLKIKLSPVPGRDAAKLRWLSRLFGADVRVRGDANNLWSDAHTAIAALSALGSGLWAVEEPTTAGDLEGFRRVSQALGIPVILDESLYRVDQIERLAADPARWIVNLRVAKLGGMRRTLAAAQQAARLGIPVIFGAHVGETSILTRAALAAAAAAGITPLAREGAFGRLLIREDVTAEPIRFGYAGRLDPMRAPWRGRPGLGFAVDPGRLVPL